MLTRSPLVMTRMVAALLVAVLGALALPLHAVKPAAAAPVNIYAAFQRFEGGVMIWKSDVGDVWVLFNDSTFLNYAEAAYASLPDNPVTDNPPAGKIKPIRGFGRVWGNFPLVRQKLGWGLEGEYGFTLTMEVFSPTVSAPVIYAFALPDGRVAEILTTTWRYKARPGNTPRNIQDLPRETRMGATYQRFENGFMLWMSDTGGIWVFADSGAAGYYTSQSYGAKRDNPVRETPPTGKFKPVFGFGKVWGHFPSVRQQLGWATAGEQGYRLTFERVAAYANGPVNLIFSLPDGRKVSIGADNIWRFVR